ncbi:hypothetical protein C8F01DRAFT_101290 [Mycena amicta]|nr:hypothetical protein C8F01DRAFT_101290 [Mycena amicta]
MHGLGRAQAFLLLSFLHFSVLAQETPSVQVTLWQFGQGRLLNGPLGTLPLIPLGTAPAQAGGATTYLYQALIPTTIAAQGVVETGTLTSARTIIASASGWMEPFGGGDNIACNLINANFGACVTGTASLTANTGVPTPEVLQVALNVLPPAGSIILSVPSSTIIPVNFKSSTPGPSTAVIVGAVFASLVGLSILAGIWFVLWRRRLRREMQVEDGLAPRGFTLDDPGSEQMQTKISSWPGGTIPTLAGHRRDLTVETATTLAPGSTSNAYKSRGDSEFGVSVYSPASPSVYTDIASALGPYSYESHGTHAEELEGVPSNLTTSDLARILYQRVNQQGQLGQSESLDASYESDAPPTYSGPSASASRTDVKTRRGVE